MGNDNMWSSSKDVSAKEYETRYGEKRTGRRITTPAGVVYAVKQAATSEYKIWRMDQLLGSVRKSTRPTCWIASLPDGKHSTTENELKWCVEHLQMAIPVSSSITDIATKHYAEKLVRKYGAEVARDATIGPARKAVEQFIDVHCPECSLSQAKGITP